ncbi:MAG TPA: ABC transporter permease, partial [Terriglobales bacterium]|nr:ABC transporter permease [Terriglobales bacterium]
MGTLLQDVRYGLRTLLKSPGFTAVAVITLALGIGANSAMFSLVHELMFGSLPFAHPEQLVTVVTRWRKGGYGPNVVPAYADAIIRQNHSFQSLAVTFPSTGCNLVGGSSPEYVSDKRVSAGFFRTLGIAPALGRDFVEADEVAENGNVALMSYGLWVRRFGGQPGVLGREVQCNGKAYTVIGVLPRGFAFGVRADIWMPGHLASHLGEDGMNYDLIARLRPGTTMASAQSDLDGIFQQLRRQRPEAWWTKNTLGPGAVAYRKWVLGDLSRPLLIMSGAVGLVLLIACANIAGLLLARSASRKCEFAVRLALGATRARVVRQLLTEAVLLNLLGGAAAVALAWWSMGTMKAVIPIVRDEFISNLSDVNLSSLHVDRAVLLFALVVSVISGVLSGVAPAVLSSATELEDSLRQGERSGAWSRGRQRGRKALLVGEIAISLVLLAGASLLARSMMMVHRVNLGFDPSNLQVAELSYSSRQFSGVAQVWQFQEKVLQRIRRLPGVAGAAAISSPPMSAGLNLPPPEVAGKQCPEDDVVEYRAASPGYFAVMRTPILLGREFSESDSAASEPVVVINQTLARACFGSANPLGRQLLFGRAMGEKVNRPLQVVGVVEDAREYAANAPVPPIMFVPQAQVPPAINELLYQSFALLSAVVVRTSAAEALDTRLQQAVWAVDPQEPVASVTPMSQMVSNSIAFLQMLMLLMAVFAGLALLLAAVGLYGLISYYVSQRTREIGVRMALGADRREVLAQVLGEGLGLMTLGGLAGLAGAFAATRLLKSLLFGVTATDPASLA